MEEHAKKVFDAKLWVNYVAYPRISVNIRFRGVGARFVVVVDVLATKKTVKKKLYGQNDKLLSQSYDEYCAYCFWGKKGGGKEGKRKESF